jgi:uncharacterized repeat protein (TIGR01451 family)
MKRIILLSVFLSLNTILALQAQGFRKIYPLSSVSNTDAVLVTADGGFLFFANTGSSNTFFYLVKTDPQGDTVWVRKHNKPEQAAMINPKLFLVSGGNYALSVPPSSYTKDSLALMIFNPAGHLLTQRLFAGGNVVSTVNGGFFLAGMLKPDSIFYIQRLDTDLNTLWEKPLTIGNIRFKYLLDMVTTPDGGFCIQSAIDSAGVTQRPQLIKADAAGNLEWQRIYNEAYSINRGNLLQAPNGDFILNNRNQSSYNSYIMRTTENGELIWVRQLDFIFPSLCLTPAGDLMLCGSALSGLGKWIWYKLGGNGDPLDAKIIANNQYQSTGACIANTPDGGLIMGGSAFNGALWKPSLVKIDYNGYVFQHFISGRLRYDRDHNCTTNPTDPPLAGWQITATSANGVESGRSAANGTYELNVPAGAYSLQIHPPNSLWKPCDNGMYSITLAGVTDTAVQDFWVQDSTLCTLLDVSLATGFLRPCRNTYYTVSWYNQGTVKAENASIAVALPPGLDFISATHVAEVHGDTLRFFLGDVDYLKGGSLQIEAYVDCDVVQAGQTLCSKAFIFPDTLCLRPAQWSGGRVVADARCVGDTLVEFSLTNMGDAPTQTLNYRITEDYLALQNGNTDLDPGEWLLLKRLANGSTQRIEMDQEPGYPFPSFPSAAIEGCGGWNNPGYINPFPVDDAGPFVDIDCREVTSSLDPNDKQGFPTGYSGAHLIEPETELTYLIRFQNTGTDTAFYVEIRDTLSPWLDPATLQMGAASHPYDWNIRGGDALSFRFNNILLPDSNTNEAASHGFIQFRVQPKKGVPLGTLIENTSSIYFDFNAPVVTNTTYHRLGRDFYAVTMLKMPGVAMLPVQVLPNPFREQTRIVLPPDAGGDYQFRLYDAAGRLLQSTAFSGTELTLQAAGLTQGYYGFELLNKNKQVAARGKIVRQ